MFLVMFQKEAQARTPSSESKGSNEAVVDRFRSARFGMTEKAALKPIFNDFKIPKSKIQRRLHPTEKTVSFNILVNDLLPNSGKVNLFYFFDLIPSGLFRSMCFGERWRKINPIPKE